MTRIAKVVFFPGLALALFCGFLRATGNTLYFLPWLVGGAGILCGLVRATPGNRTIVFLGLIGLVVALTAILLQDYNPGWLTDTAFFVRVFFAHILLSYSLIHFLIPARA